jgi:predicted TIM-barrel fold metal-dependent hydrolase
MYNGMKVFDAHCHIYPETIAQKAVEGIGGFYGAELYGRGTLADLLEKGAQSGIDRFLVHSVATKDSQVRSINEFIAEEVSREPERIIGFGTLYPFGGHIEEDYEHLRALGLHGIKLHPDCQRCEADAPGYRKIYEMCERDGFPVLIHTGDSRYDFSNPDRMERVLRDYPGLRIIGAHFGGWSVWKEAAEKLCKYENFYVDSCSTTAYLSGDEVLGLIETYGAKRVLFGTDYPMWAANSELKTLSGLGLSENELSDIFYGNAARFLGL